MADPITQRYPGYDVLAKWNGPSFNEPTREVLRRRLDGVPERRFFSLDEFRLLEAICARLIPQPDRAEPIPIAPWIDTDLHDGKGEGFRHPDMPPLPETWRKGLAGIESEARRRHGRAYVDLEGYRQDSVLAAVQNGEAAAEGFGGLPVVHFFDQVLLKAAVGVYYSHPEAWNEIGYGGPASPRGYVRLGLDERDPWEAPLVAIPRGGR
jgi:hypothetical protein